MLRTRAGDVSLWEAVLPAEVLRLPEELARVDALLDDPVFFVPFLPFFDPRVGRPSTPMETYLRMMFLKFRYGLGYESLCREVSDSITWRRFCRIPIDGNVPHPTTLMKLTTRCGIEAVQGCNAALLAKAAQAKLLRTTGVARRHHGGPGRRGLFDRLGVAGQGGAADRGGRSPGSGRWWGDPHTFAGPRPFGWETGAWDRREAPAAFGAGQGGGAGHRAAHHRGARLPRGAGCRRRRRRGCPTPAERCAARRPRPRHSPRQGVRTPRPAGGGAGCGERSTT